MKQLFFSLALLILFSCSKKEEKEHLLLKATLDKTEVSISEIFSSFEVIPLETSDNSLLVWPDKMLCIENDYVVFDSRQAAVFLYDEKGKFIRKIGNKGDGPQEYNEIYDILYNEAKGTIEMLSPFGEIFIYRPDGKFVDRKRLPQKLNYQSFAVKDNFYATWSIPSTSDDYCISLISQDNCLLMDELWKSNPNLCLLYPRVFYPYKSNLYFYRPFDRKVYKMEKDGLQIAYEWEFGNENYSLTEWNIEPNGNGDSKGHLQIMKLLKNGTIPYVFSKQSQNKHYFYANIVFKFTPTGNHHLFYNKQNNQTLFFDKTKEGIDFFPLYLGEDYILIKIDTPFIPALKKLIAEDVYENLLKRTEEDNPIILKCVYR